MTTNHKAKAESGFTLAQMAVVILLAGMLINLGLVASRTMKERTAVTVTKKRLEVIETALVAYMTRHSRLPCPDDATSMDGAEDIDVVAASGNGGTCDSESGLLPYNDLDLQRSVVMDGWEHFFTYRVDEDGNSWTTGATFNLTDVGDIEVKTRDSSHAEISQFTDAVLVVLSHGRNGFGGYTTEGTQTYPLTNTDLDEYVNSNSDDTSTVFFKREHTDDTEYLDPDLTTIRGAFDDFLLVMRSANFIGGMEEQNQLIAKANDELNAFKDSVVSYALSNISGGTALLPTTSTRDISPDPLDGITCKTLTCIAANIGTTPQDSWSEDYGNGLDPWGNAYIYAFSDHKVDINGDGIEWRYQITNANTGNVFTFHSWGPDKSNGTSDDISVSMTVAELISVMIQDGSMASGEAEIQQAQKEIGIINEAAYRFNIYLYNYVDSEPTEVDINNKDADKDEDGNGTDDEDTFDDPANYKNDGTYHSGTNKTVSPSIGYYFLDENCDVSACTTLPPTPSSSQNRTAIDVLATHGFIPGSLKTDPWGIEYRWDTSSHQFYSEGPVSGCLVDTNDEISSGSTASDLGGDLLVCANVN